MAQRSAMTIVYSKALISPALGSSRTSPTPAALHLLWQNCVNLPSENINYIISNNCHRQFASQSRDFVLIDFLSFFLPTLIRFPLIECLLKALHKEIYKCIIARQRQARIVIRGMNASYTQEILFFPAMLIYMFEWSL